MDTHIIEPGQILHARWGYDQTNATFFKVLARRGQWVVIQPLSTEEAWRGDTMTGTATPSAKLDGKPIRRKVRGNGNWEAIKVKSYMYASPWDGEPVRISCYA